jgi:hypothetical protein
LSFDNSAPEDPAPLPDPEHPTDFDALSGPPPLPHDGDDDAPPRPLPVALVGGPAPASLGPSFSAGHLAVDQLSLNCIGDARAYYCPADRTEYRYDVELGMFVPDPTNTLIRRFVESYRGPWAFGFDDPETLVQALRRHPRVVLAPAVALSEEPGRFKRPGEPPLTAGAFIRRDGLPVLPRAGTGGLVGPKGIAKTWFAVSVALALGDGQPLPGYEIEAPADAWVLVIGAENADDIHRRLEVLGSPKRRVLLWDRPVVLTDPESVIDFVRRARTQLPPTARVALVIVDTLNQSLGPGDEENSNDTMRKVIRVGGRMLCRAFPGSANLIVHHPNAEGTKARGGSAFEDNADFVLWAEGTDEDDAMDLTVRKMKTGRQLRGALRHRFERVLDDGGHDVGLRLQNVERATRAGAADHFTPARRLMLDLLEEVAGSGSTEAEWRTQADDRHSIGKAPFNRVRDWLNANGYARKLGGRWYATKYAPADV